MSHKKPFKEGEKFNLYEQDFTGLVALTTSEAGRLFFGAVFDGVIPGMMYDSTGESVYVGRLRSEDEAYLYLERAFGIKPQQLRQGHLATNYSPLDCLRGLWFDVVNLAPETLKSIVVKKDRVLERMDLKTGQCT